MSTSPKKMADSILAGLRFNDSSFYTELISPQAGESSGSFQAAKARLQRLLQGTNVRFVDRTREKITREELLDGIGRNLSNTVNEQCKSIKQMLSVEADLPEKGEKYLWRSRMNLRESIPEAQACWRYLRQVLDQCAVQAAQRSMGDLILRLEGMKKAYCIAQFVTYQLWYGMGFFHCMDSAPYYEENGELDTGRYTNQPLSRMRILAWTNFCCEVYRNEPVEVGGTKKPLAQVNFLEYLRSLYHPQDAPKTRRSRWQEVLSGCLLPLTADYLCMKQMTEKYPNWRNTQWREATQELLTMLADPQGQDNRSYFADMTVGEFFSLLGSYDFRFVALGSALHVVIDSFCPYNTARDVEEGTRDYRTCTISQFRRLDAGEPREGGSLEAYGLASSASTESYILDDMCLMLDDAMDMDIEPKAKSKAAPVPEDQILFRKDAYSELTMACARDFLDSVINGKALEPLLEGIFPFHFHQSRCPRGLDLDGLTIREDIDWNDAEVFYPWNAKKTAKSIVSKHTDAAEAESTLAEMAGNLNQSPGNYLEKMKSGFWGTGAFGSISDKEMDSFDRLFGAAWDFDKYAGSYSRTPLVRRLVRGGAFCTRTFRRLEDAALERRVAESEPVVNYVALCLARIAKALESGALFVDSNGNLVNDGCVDYELQGLKRPAFDSFSDNMNYLGILVHSTQGLHMDLVLDDAAGKTPSSGRLKLTVYDHFGLDAPDLKKFMDKGAFMWWKFGDSFCRWYIMQHCSNQHPPYITEMVSTFTFSIQDRAVYFQRLNGGNAYTMGFEGSRPMLADEDRTILYD